MDKFKILHLEDSPIDARLIQDILSDEWNNCRIDVVDSENSFCKAISDQQYDLILADYVLPGLNGIAALEIARLICPDIPFIFVSGALGEETAIEMLKKGAVDYVLKSNLTRLIPAVDRALKEAADQAHRRQIERELSNKNAEIEQFIYTVSHDLRSPLVTIKIFLGYLQQDMASGDNENVAKDLDYITSAAGRMEMLLNELLEVSRVGRVSSNPTLLTFAALMDEVLGDNAGKISAENIAFKVEGDVELYGDRRQLWQIWQNLIDNAIKYIGKPLQPEITVGVDPAPEEPVFFVRDNGIGIPPEYHDKVFGIFEKLNAASEGVGMGLTMVRRIVELYDGKITVESDGLETGSCFRFTLPKAIKRQEHEAL